MAKQRSSTNPKYPHVKVKLVGEDGNAYAILERVQGAMRKNGVEKSEIDAFMTEAMEARANHIERLVQPEAYGC